MSLNLYAADLQLLDREVGEGHRSEVARQEIERVLAHPGLGVRRAEAERDRAMARVEDARKLFSILERLRGNLHLQEVASPKRFDPKRWASLVVRNEPLLKGTTTDELLKVLRDKNLFAKVDELEQRVNEQDRELERLRAQVAADVRKWVLAKVDAVSKRLKREAGVDEVLVWLEGDGAALQDYRLISATNATLPEFLAYVRRLLGGPP